MELLLPLIFLLPLLFIVSRSRKQQRQTAELQARLEVGQEVMTSSGAFGRIVEVEDSVVVLEMAPGVRLRWVRQAVTRILDEPAGGASTAPDAA